MINLDMLPTPNEKNIAVHVNKLAEKAIRSGHPWLFDGSIESMSHDGEVGDRAIIFDSKRRFLALGLYDPFAPIRVRIIHRGKPSKLDAAFLLARVQSCFDKRAELSAMGTTGYRLIHGGNDQLPGVVVDCYDETLVLKLYSLAWVAHLQPLLQALLQVCEPQRVVLRLSRAVAKHSQYLFGLYDGVVLYGEPVQDDVVFQENGLFFQADVVDGQKTGFFLDQRENRAQVEVLAKGKRVLNMFAYTGGFSLYAARGGAHTVLSVDLSEPALQTAVTHFTLNENHPQIAQCQHDILVADAFQAFSQLKKQAQRFNMVIIDPPSFAKKQSEVEGAIGAYKRLAQQGLAVLAKGGILVAASCSSRVSAEAFFALVEAELRRTKRPFTILQRTQHALDHPIGFREGAYLKCLFAQMND